MLTVTNVLCPPLRITLGQLKSENNNRTIQLTGVFCVQFKYNGTSNILLQLSSGHSIINYNITCHHAIIVLGLGTSVQISEPPRP